MQQVQEAREAALELLPLARSEHLQWAQPALSPLPPWAQLALVLAEQPLPALPLPQPLTFRERQEREPLRKQMASTVVPLPPPA